MRGRSGVITTLLTACAAAVACGGGGHHNNPTVVTQTSFPQGFLPALMGTGRGDVALRLDGPLFAVQGSDDVIVVSNVDGSVATHDVDDTQNPALISITAGFGADGRWFAGDTVGRIWEIAPDGLSATVFVNTNTGQPIKGLAFSPSGFGPGGELYAAVGTGSTPGIYKVSGTPSQAGLFLAGNYVDLAFSPTTLMAIDATDAQVDAINADASISSSRGGFVTPVGIAVDSAASEIYVADAGAGLLYTMPVASGAPTARAPYHFDAAGPSGISCDGVAAIAFVTTDPPAIRGANLPRIDPAGTNFTGVFVGPTVGYGDLEFDKFGGFTFVANDDDSGVAGDTTNNFIFTAERDLSSASALNTGIGDASHGEQLLALAIDPKTQAFYIGTSFGNLFRRAAADGSITQLIDAPDGSPAILGLELAPASFCAPDPDPCLVATTENGKVIVIDLGSPNLTDVIRTEPGARLSDLVFASDGTLYVVDDDDDEIPPTRSRILELDQDGSLIDQVAVDGRVDGIEIDEGGDRLLATAQPAAGSDQLLEITLPISPSSDVTPIGTIDIDDGYFPTGIVYDRLGVSVSRKGNNFTGLEPKDTLP
jgi:hypothetical protein